MVKKTKLPYYELDGVCPNPRLDKVNEGIALCRTHAIDFILAVGGGSVIDTAKAIAAGVSYHGDVWDLFRTHTGPREAIRVGTVLTIAGSGSEMNGNAVITNGETGEKRSTSSPVLAPVFSILNPVFTFSVPPLLTAAGIADSMAHILEMYLSPLAGCPVQDCMSEALMRMCLEQGPMAVQMPDNYDIRAALMWTSTLALNGFVNKGKVSDWILHALEHELSGRYDSNHGTGLAILLPAYLRCLAGKPERRPAVVAYARNVLGIAATVSDMQIADTTARLTRDFFNDLGLPEHLASIGIDSSYFAEMAHGTLRTRNTVGHFPQLHVNDVLAILHQVQ